VPALTLYLTTTNDTLVTTARQFSSSAPTPESAVNGTTDTGPATPSAWYDVPSQGGASILTGGPAEPGAAQVDGFIFNSTVLEGATFSTGNWTPSIKIGIGALSVGDTVTYIFRLRLWKRSSAGVFTQIGADFVGASHLYSGAGGATPVDVGFTAQSITGFTLAVGDKLYIDILGDQVANNVITGGATFSLAENGGAADALVTPGYSVAGGGADNSGVFGGARDGFLRREFYNGDTSFAPHALVSSGQPAGVVVLPKRPVIILQSRQRAANF
jgi:uncharacterized membrane protein